MRRVIEQGTIGAAVALICVSSPVRAEPASTGSGQVLELLNDSREDWARFWSERSFRKKKPTAYKIVDADGGFALRGDSAGSASAIWRKLNLDDLQSGRLSWRWRVEGSLSNNDRERDARGDDYAARVFVFFGKKPFSRGTRALCYVWAGRETVGSVYPNPSFATVATVVLQSGDTRAGVWVRESRDIAADYRRAFGSAPAKPAGVAFMIDTDDTGARTTAWLDQLVLDIRNPPVPGAPRAR